MDLDGPMIEKRSFSCEWGTTGGGSAALAQAHGPGFNPRGTVWTTGLKGLWHLPVFSPAAPCSSGPGIALGLVRWPAVPR